MLCVPVKCSVKRQMKTKNDWNQDYFKGILYSIRQTQFNLMSRHFMKLKKLPPPEEESVWLEELLGGTRG